MQQENFKFRRLIWSWGLLTLGAYSLAIQQLSWMGLVFIIISDFKFMTPELASKWLQPMAASLVASLICVATFAFPKVLFDHTSQGVSPKPWFVAVVGVLWMLGIWWVYRRWKSKPGREATTPKHN